MRKLSVISTLMLAVFGMGLESAFGQTASPAPSAPLPPRPTLSPYLNLLNRNNSTAFNYYNFVRPRQAFDDYRQQTGTTLQNLDRRIDRSQQLIQQSQNSLLQPSGHQTRFLDYGGYFGTGPAQNQFGVRR